MVGLSSSLESEPIESERMAESVVERNAGDHDGFNLPRFAMSLVQLRSHQLDFPGQYILIRFTRLKFDIHPAKILRLK